jgi:hypothetical protein
VKEETVEEVDPRDCLRAEVGLMLEVKEEEVNHAVIQKFHFPNALQIFA